MTRYLLLVLGVLVAAGCGEPDPGGEDPVALEREAGRILADGDAADPRRIEAGLKLLGTEGGIERVAGLWGDDAALVLRIWDRASPAEGARLGAALLETVSGEAKVDVAARLAATGPAAVEPLVELLHRDADWQSQVQALQALGKLKAEAALSVMRTKLQDRETWVRMASAHALGEIGGEAATSALVSALYDPEDTVVAAALVALGRTGNREAVALCAPKLLDDNPRVRAAAVSAIGRLGDRDDAPLIEPLLGDSDDGVRHKARRALADLTETP